MGDITDRPKAPAAQVVYVPKYVYTNPTTTPSTPTSTDGNDPDLTPEQQREKNLLSRPRSRIGTILTGFRGILSPAESQSQSQKKTLLGE